MPVKRYDLSSATSAKLLVVYGMKDLFTNLKCRCFKGRPKMVSKLPLRTPSTCSACRQFLRMGLH